MPRQDTKLMTMYAGDLEARRRALLTELEYAPTATGRAQLAKVNTAIAVRAIEVIEYLTITAAQGRAKVEQFTAQGKIEIAEGWQTWVTARERRIREIEGAIPEVVRMMGEFRLPTAA
jgi:hypothetical protein